MASVFEEVLKDAAETVYFAFEGLETTREAAAFFFFDLKFAQALFKKLDIEAKGGERVFDFVGKAAGHGADFGKAFGRSAPVLRPEFWQGCVVSRGAARAVASTPRTIPVNSQSEGGTQYGPRRPHVGCFVWDFYQSRFTAAGNFGGFPALVSFLS